MKRLFPCILMLALLPAVLSATEMRTLSLEECVNVALEKNPEILQQEFNQKITGRDEWIAASNFLPQASIGMGYDHSVIGPSSSYRIDSQTGILVPVQTSEVESWGSSARASVQQTFFNGGYNYFNYKQSRQLKKAADFGFEDTKQSIIYTVKERYYNLLMREKLLEVSEESMKSAEESFKQADAMYQVGKVPKSDVLTAQVQLEQSRLDLIEAQNMLSIAKASLNQVLGFQVDDEIGIVDNLDVPEESNIDYETAMTSSMTSHPSLLKSQFNVKAAKSGIGMAASQFLPTVSGYFQYNWNHRDFDQISNMFDKDYNWQMGLSLSLPIFDGFSRIAQTSKAKLNYHWNEEVLSQTKRSIALEVKEAFFNMNQAKRKITVAKSGKEAANENLRLNQEKYNLGAGTMLDLITAQVQFSTANSDYIQSLYSYKLGVARLQKAMGELKQ